MLENKFFLKLEFFLIEYLGILKYFKNNKIDNFNNFAQFHVVCKKKVQTNNNCYWSLVIT